MALTIYLYVLLFSLPNSSDDHNHFVTFTVSSLLKQLEVSGCGAGIFISKNKFTFVSEIGLNLMVLMLRPESLVLYIKGMKVKWLVSVQRNARGGLLEQTNAPLHQGPWLLISLSISFKEDKQIITVNNIL